MDVDPSEDVLAQLDSIPLPKLDLSESPTDPMFKFMNGEISFDDCLSQMDNNDSKVQNLETSTDELRISIPMPPSPTKSDSSIDNAELSDIPFSISESDDEDDTYKRKPKKKGGRKGKRSKLSPTLRALMGQANVCHARGDTENAVQMCLEIIKEAPTASEPFKTLASIYEEMGDHEKSLQMRLLAAHLGTVTKDEWAALADVLRKQNKYRQAVLCLTRAINLDPLNVSYYEERADTMKKANISSVDAYGYPRLLYKLDATKNGPILLSLCKKVSQIYYSDKKFDKALTTLKYAFDNCPNLITFAEANLYLEVLIMVQNFEECIRVLIQFCKVDIRNLNINGENRVVKCVTPENMPADIRTKLIITLIFKEAMECAKTEIEILLKEDAEEMGDLFWDVGLVLFEKNLFIEALNLVLPLTKTTKFNSVNLWFKLTQCYKEINEIDKCLQCYRKAVEFFPDDGELKLKFCDELMDAKLYQEAIEVTLSDGNDLSVLIYERCKLYLLVKDYDSFLKTGWQLFRLHCKEIVTYEDFLVFSTVLNQPKSGNSILSQNVPATVDTSVPLEDEWKIFLQMSELYIEKEEYEMFLLLTTSLYISFKFLPKRNDLKMAMIVACSMNNNCDLGYDLVREIIHTKKVDSDRMWNTLNLCTLKTEYTRLHKFIIRFLLKQPNEFRAVMLYANNCLIAGTYKYALNDHTILFQKSETPMLALLIGINLANISCQKFTTNKYALVSQAITFFSKYKQLRGDDASQEVCYNTGRFFHQIELLPQAIFYYKKGLECDPPLQNAMVNLKCDIAYNLHLIYLNSGQPELANLYLRKYVVI